MTATEAALYDRLVDGNLRKAMGNLTHQNLPLSMFLEAAELGVPAWTGGGGIISDDNIIKYLGAGTVNFGAEDAQTPPAVETHTITSTALIQTSLRRLQLAQALKSIPMHQGEHVSTCRQAASQRNM